MNTTSRPSLARPFARGFSAYAAVPADRDAQRMAGDLAALPVTDCAYTATGASGWHRLFAAFHRSPSA